MESGKLDLGQITQIPENEFKEHFREWMEQDDVARCLQAKLRKDLIMHFNKTSLGKKLLAQTAASHRLNLSPLVLAINTLVAEFLYAQNCHFTLSVFCTEVPYRNTLPDFESVPHFRFSEPELLEIFDALCSNWSCTIKGTISKHYTAEKTSSLLFVLLKCLLHGPIEKASDPSEPPDPVLKNEPKKDKGNASPDVHQYRYLNKFLIVFLKRAKEMTTTMAALQAQKVGPQSDRKSINMRKLDSLHRSMHKISENLRKMSVTKRKSRDVTTIVSAINSMAKQFERCAGGFHQASKQMTVNAKQNEAAPVGKSYSDWIKEMRTTPNGQKFLEKVEQSLHKALLRERDKLEEEFHKRLQVQKNILKSKYKQKLSEELLKFTAREKADASQQMTDTLQKRLNEYELKTKEIHDELYASGTKPKHTSQADLSCADRTPSWNKVTQTCRPSKETSIPVMEPKTADQRREQVGSIVFDAKQRVQQLEHESNQLERNIREFLEKQKSEKRILNESASSILNTYAIERSILEKKYAAFRSTTAPANKVVNSSIIDTSLPRHSSAELNVNAADENIIVPATFQNAFRTAHEQIVAKHKAHPQARREAGPSITHQHFSSVLELINKGDKDDADSLTSPPCRAASKVTVYTSTTPRFKIKEVTSGATESGLSTEKSPSPGAEEANGNEPNPAAVYKVGRQMFEMIDNGIPSEGNGQQMNSNHCREPESSVKQINNDNGDGDAKKITGYADGTVGANTAVTARVSGARGENKVSSVRCEKAPTVEGALETPVELEACTSSSVG